MGLDMFLTRKMYVKNWGDPHYKVEVTYNGKKTSLNPKNITHVVEEIGYWRKANAIHKWFVDNVQDGKDDCGEYCVPAEDLNKLMETCFQVLANPKLGKELLPTTDGFFFGGTDYDNGYLQDLKNTVEICKIALDALEDDNSSVYYQASW